MTVVPQQYRLQCVYSGWYNEFRWYNNNTELNCGSPQNGFSCDINPPGSNPLVIRSFFTFTVTWYAEEISSGIFSQSNNNGDHVHRCYVRTVEIKRNRYLTISGKYFYYYSYIMSYVILSAPEFTPSLTLVNKTATTITVSWTPVPSGADGYIVNVTSDTHTVTHQVKGGSQNEITLKGLITATKYNITIRAYQDILGPASNAISVQTLSSGIVMSTNLHNIKLFFSYFINQLDICLIHYSTSKHSISY